MKDAFSPTYRLTGMMRDNIVTDTALENEAGRTILLVGDEPEVLAVLAEVLSMVRYTVVPKPDAESALSFLREGNLIDLVITDLLMPGMNGSDFVQVLNRMLPSVPAIMLTAYGSVESYIETRSLGVFEYVNKPVQARELRRIVKAAIDWSKTVPSPDRPV